MSDYFSNYFMRGSSLEGGPLTSNEIGKEEYEFMLGTVVVANNLVRSQKFQLRSFLQNSSKIGGPPIPAASK